MYVCMYFDGNNKNLTQTVQQFARLKILCLIKAHQVNLSVNVSLHSNSNAAQYQR